MQQQSTLIWELFQSAEYAYHIKKNVKSGQGYSRKVRHQHPLVRLVSHRVMLVMSSDASSVIAHPATVC